jgi:hypothetical protein
MTNVEPLGDILPVKHDSHTEPLSCYETDGTLTLPTLFSPHELLLVNGFNALMHEGDKIGTGDLIRHCRIWTLCRPRAVLICLDVKGESAREYVPSPSAGTSVSEFRRGYNDQPVNTRICL